MFAWDLLVFGRATASMLRVIRVGGLPRSEGRHIARADGQLSGFIRGNGLQHRPRGPGEGAGWVVSSRTPGEPGCPGRVDPRLGSARSRVAVAAELPVRRGASRYSGPIRGVAYLSATRSAFMKDGEIVGLMQRASLVFKAKASKALDKAEDPRETLDYSYERQMELLQQVRRGVADVATSKKRLELQSTQLEQSVQKLEGQARDAMAAGREDLARTALERKKAAQLQLQGLDEQHTQLQAEQDKLMQAQQRLTAKVEAFRTQKETIKAQYTAAEAQAKIGEAVSGISEEMGDVGMSMQRAQDKVATMQARAGAIDELLDSGALQDISSPGRDSIDQELDQISAKSGVDSELAALKKELGTGPDAPAGDAPADGAA